MSEDIERDLLLRLWALLYTKIQWTYSIAGTVLRVHHSADPVVEGLDPVEGPRSESLGCVEHPTDYDQ